MGDRTRGYRDLIAWQKAMDLVPQVYELTKRFPREEQFALTNQIKRAAVSVPANIAEGQGSGSPRQFMRYHEIARASLSELDTLLEIGVRVGYLEHAQLAPVVHQIVEIRKLIHGLLRQQSQTPS